MENKMVDKNSSIFELTDVLKTKQVSASAPYPYLSGLCFGLLNQTQRKKLAEVINAMPDKENK
jgi:hypothetical protein